MSTITTTTAAQTAQPTTRGLGDISPKLAGIGALSFVVTVIGQNIVRGASAPANDASTTEVLTQYADHRSVTCALVAMFVISGSGLAIFLGGALRRMLASDRRGWAVTGLAGGLGILTLFSVLVANEQALTVIAARDQPDLGAVEALWTLHNSVFTVLLLFIGIALLGLSRAGIAAGVTPPAFARIAPVASAMLAIAAVAGPWIAAGDAMALFAMGGIGFLTWLAFLLATGLRLLRAEDAS